LSRSAASSSHRLTARGPFSFAFQGLVWWAHKGSNLGPAD
jgi:hypothetical protein